MLSFVFHIQGQSTSLTEPTNANKSIHIHSRENTVLRGQLFERSDEDPNVLEVRKSVYVIPSALIAEQFTPCPPPPSDKRLFLFLLTIITSSFSMICSNHRRAIPSYISERSRPPRSDRSKDLCSLSRCQLRRW